MAPRNWPRRLWVVRHGQSAGNVALDAAEQAKAARIDIHWRDMDTPLSALGEKQATALGRWFGQMPRDEQPTVLLCSPYVRAHRTAALLMEAAGLAQGDRLHLVRDERLREKEFGLLDRLTRYGIAEKFPELVEQRRHVGKFYFRPPGGESWCDVILRLRSLHDTLARDYEGERVLIVAHQVVVTCMRYLLEGHDEHGILDIDRSAMMPNCSVTSYDYDPTLGHNGGLSLRLVNFVAPLIESGAPVTAAPDAQAAPSA